jgi:uncharacterized integral membrane protein
MEPKLEDIGDYDTLKGEKKKIVWTVIIVGIIIGIGFEIFSEIYDNKNEEIQVKNKIVTAPAPFGATAIPVK